MLEPRAILTFNNCLAHPHSDLLISTYGKRYNNIIFAPDVTSLIQPMNLGNGSSEVAVQKNPLHKTLMI